MDTWYNFTAEIHSLSDEDIQHLHSYVRLYRIGKFIEAQRLYDAKLCSYVPSHGVVVVEHSDGLLAESRFGALVQFLDESLNSNAFYSPQREYLSLMKSLAEIYTFGCLRPALQNARAFRKTLESVKWKDFSIYKVSAMEITGFIS